MRNKIISHPGTILKEEFLEEMGISQYELARQINVPKTRISAICKGERDITSDTALRLAMFFETSAEFWLNLQTHYDLVMTEANFTPPAEMKTAKVLSV